MNIENSTGHKRQMTYLHLAIWSAAILVGAAAVLYAKLIAWSQEIYFHGFSAHPYLLSLATPLLFILATGLVKVFAIEAKGSGIPQVLEAIELASFSGVTNRDPFSYNTACFVDIGFGQRNRFTAGVRLGD